MNDLRKLIVSVLVAGILLLNVPVLSAPVPKPPKEPARIELTVDPAAVEAGGRTRVTVQLTPASGIRINRYPKMKLSVEAHDGVIDATEVAMGNDGPPPPDDMERNYYDTVDPLVLDLDVDSSAESGSHDVSGRLVFYYCVKASGFCAPKRQSVTIPIEVR